VRDGVQQYDSGDWLAKCLAVGSMAMTFPAPPESERDARRFRLAGVGSRGRQANADDDAIVTELYRRYRTPLLAYVLRLTGGDRQQAEDVVQETMVRAWRQAGQLDLAAPSLMPWLVTVARRIVIDQGRRRRARPTETGDQMLENVPVADTTEDLLRKVVVTEAMQALSAAHREILNETILRDRSVSQAAEALGIPVGTVKSRVYYALRALRLVLAERGVSV
jgi:RNA polymerase sigma-70 factor, ECF subfamily